MKEGIEDTYITITKELLNEGTDPHIIADTLIALSLNLYSELINEHELAELLQKLYKAQVESPIKKFVTVH